LYQEFKEKSTFLHDSLTMDLLQLEQSCWATLKANKMHMKSVFSV